MKRIFLALALALCLTQRGDAMAAITEENIKAAQAFGESQKNVTLENLVQKWTILDSKKTNRYGDKERVIVYTPYVVAAIDAQNSAKNGAVATLQQGMQRAREYEGILAIDFIIDSVHKVEPQFLKIQIEQDGSFVEPYSTTLNKAAVYNKVLPEKNINTSAGGISAAEKAKLDQVKQEVEQKAKQAVSPNKTAAQQPAAAGKSPAQVPGKVTTTNVPVKEPAKAAPVVTVKVWTLEYLSFFDLSKVSTAKPLTLTVSDQAGGPRVFKINLNSIN